MKIFAIINYYKDIDIFENIVKRLPTDIPNKVVVFNSFGVTENKEFPTVEFIPIDPEFNRAQAKNFALKTLKEKFNSGFAYVFEDKVIVNEEKFKAWIPEHEKFMTAFNYDVWFNTVLDECNFIFDKYVYGLQVEIDEKELSDKFKNRICVTTNANTKLIVYNLDLIDINDKIAFFNEDFKITMFIILEFFSRRRAANRPGSFMGMYLTIEQEKGIISEIKNHETTLKFNEWYEEEAKKFEAMKIDIQPTSDVDLLMEFIETSLRNMK